MAEYSIISATIRTIFDAGMIIAQPTLLRFYDGQKVEASQINNREFVRLNIIFGQSKQVAMGNSRLVRTVGIASVGIWIPSTTGHGRAYTIADSIASIWQVSTMSGVIFRACSLNPVGEDGPWTQFNAVTPFQSDELVTA